VSDNPWAANLGGPRPRGTPGTGLVLAEWDEADRERAFEAAELEHRANQVAARLRAAKLRTGERVAILAGNCLEFLPTVLGILRAGLVAVPLAPKSTPAALASMLEDSGPALVLCDLLNRPRVPRQLACEDLAAFCAAPAESKARADADVPAAGAVALILFTSGSSGVPKGVLLTHAGMLWALRKRLQAGGLSASDRGVVAAPLAHMNGLVNLLMAYYAGASCLLLKRFEAAQYLRAISYWKATSLVAVPTMMALLARALQSDVPAPELGSVRRVLLGSAPCTAALFAAVRAIFPSAQVGLGYGATETGPLVFGPDPAGTPTPAMSIGKPLPSVDVRIEGDADKGELLVKSPSVSPGYLNRPEATATKFADGWYRTGDLVRRDTGGFYYFAGRSDDMFTCGAENVYPGEVEDALEQHPAVQQAAVVPLEDEVKGHIPVAFVVLRTAAKATDAELRAFTLARGLTYQHPRQVIILDEMPTTATGKIDRKALAQTATDRFTQHGASELPR
jgi:long-chain acyl-CoA synthetase